MGEVIRKAMRETGYTSLGTLEFLMDESAEPLFPRDEHARAGRAPGDRDGHRPRPRRAADPRRRRREARPPRHARRGASAATRSSAASTPRTRRPSRPGRASSPSTIPPGGAGVRVDSGVYGGWRVPGRLRLAPRQAHRPRADARRSHRPHAPRARRVHRRRASARTSSCTRRCSSTPRSSRGTMTTRTVERITSRYGERHAETKRSG